ncbi:MAG: hypothetical protein JW730_17980, partial [Anaerolineales bacterium]|nr:hypothetical protein [Anaerolineales bacterium]
MTEQEEFFSPGHQRLLNIATWARYLAWAVLVVFIISGISRYFQAQLNQMLYGSISGNYADFIFLLKTNPLFAASLFMQMLSIFVKGIVYFLVLKGISLGLNMIVSSSRKGLNMVNLVPTKETKANVQARYQ